MQPSPWKIADCWLRSNKMTTLKNKVALVTGAGSGIGKAIAIGLAEKGVTLCLIGRNTDALQKVAVLAKQSASQVICIQCDLRSDADIDALVDVIADQCHGLDILVHSAGIYTMGEIENASTPEFDMLLRTNAVAPFRLTQRLIPLLKQSQGDLVFINSSAGLSAGKGVAQYAASKHALKALADSFRAELNSFGVRVLSVYPGRTATPMQQDVYSRENKTYAPELLLQPEDVASIVICALELGHTAEVTDLSIRPRIKT